MRCVIMQPTFIPWSGYFNLISAADEFVYLDDVQFEKQSWQSRNAILLDKKRFLLKLQISRGSLDRKINEVFLSSESTWRLKLKRTLTETYSKHPYSSALEPVVDALNDVSLTQLSDFNIGIIEKYCDLLRIKTRRRKSSEMGITGKRSERILAICEKLNCNEYISPQGARNYIEEDNLFSNSPTTLFFQNFNPAPYSQIGTKEFISHLSIVDIMANIGPEASGQYVRTGSLTKGNQARNE